MGFKILVAAAAVAVGVGQAEAATYNGTFTLVSAVNEYEPFWWEEDQADEIIPEVWGIMTGDTVDATIKVTPDVEGVFFGLFAAGTEIFNSFLYGGSGGYEGSESGNPYYGWETLSWDGAGSGSITYFGDMRPWYPVIRGSFTVDVAPVPLPVSAALLPLGIGALAFLRRRRRLS